jgi:osmotically inducible lipoprotein OsmB
MTASVLWRTDGSSRGRYLVSLSRRGKVVDHTWRSIHAAQAAHREQVILMNTIRRIGTSTLTLAVALGLGACSGMSTQQKDTAVGAGIGAVGGAVLTGGSAIGTVGGAVVGGVIGNEVGKDDKKK